MKFGASTKMDGETFHNVYRGLSSALFRSMRGHLEEYAQKFLERFRKARFSGRPGLIHRDGALERSFRVKIGGRNLKTLKISIFSRHAAAPVQEFGAIIKAIGEGYLTFFLPDAGRWARVKQVKIPPRLGLFSMWDADTDRRSQLLQTAVAEGLQGLAARGKVPWKVA